VFLRRRQFGRTTEREHEQTRVVGREVTGCLVATDAHGDVLLAVEFIGDGACEHAGLCIHDPQFFTGGSVVGTELLTTTTALEHEAAGSGECAAGGTFVRLAAPYFLTRLRIEGDQI